MLAHRVPVLAVAAGMADREVVVVSQSMMKEDAGQKTAVAYRVTVVVLLVLADR